MKKLLAILMCVCLLSASALASGEASGGSSEARLAWINGLRELGVKSFSFFNFCHDGSRDRTVVHAATKTAHTPNPEYYLPKFYRVLSLDGIDMSTYVSS